MSDELTLFDLPVEPEQIGVMLPPASLRRIDFSALDFSTSRRAILEYIKAYYPDDFNDFVAANGIIMLSEIQASNVAKLALRGDLLATEAFLPVCKTEEATRQHLALINQKFKSQTAAVVDVEATVQSPLVNDLVLDPGMQFSLKSPDGGDLFYELFRSPGDYTGNIVIPAGKRGVMVYGIEGRFSQPIVYTSSGGINQSLTITESGILDSPIAIELDTGTELQQWTATFEPLEKFGPNERVVHVDIFTDRAELRFGDNINGASPLAGQQITVRYRVGGGIRGRIGTNALNEIRLVAPAIGNVASVQVLFRNPAPSSGGTDRETLEQAKKRAPRDFAVRAFAADRPASIVTDKDYAQVASTFSHPVYGAVAKAVATVRTSLNANLVELYVLCHGATTLVTPSVGLKQALKSYISEYNVLTDHVEILDGVAKSVDVDATVVVDRDADASYVKERVNAALDGLFDITNREMGQPLYISDIIEAIRGVDGVRYVDLFSPANNLLSTGGLAVSSADGVGINEIVVEGNRTVKFFYEKSVR